MWETVTSIYASVSAVLAFILGSVVGFGSFQIGRADRRFAVYDELRRSFDEAGMYSQIFKALDLIDDEDVNANNKGKLKLSDDVNVNTRHAFLALLERIALIWRSRLVNIRVLNYNFGHYAILAYDTDEMWPHKDDRSHPYYASLKDFIDQLRQEKKKLHANPQEYIRGVRMGGLREFFWNPFH
ncbi:hypothetical protein IE4872_PD01676 (plasmid) [Rhizobium gallicum]|uniref:DUF4760 domain-containing protein n=1 Tax=Rhizobium gallicum TaxID=56730 RepID=A0A1L5NWA9_9HYPH|nr:hypothetical protein IE4872_PD01676 [Rhizobium gallicum]